MWIESLFVHIPKPYKPDHFLNFLYVPTQQLVAYIFTNALSTDRCLSLKVQYVFLAPIQIEGARL